MNSQEALDFINRVLSERGNPVLNPVEVSLFLGIWENQRYTEIAPLIYAPDQYTRELGTKLFAKLKQDLGIIVTKRNFQNPIRHFYQEYSSNPPAVDTNGETTETTITPPPNNQNPFVSTTGRIDHPERFFNREREIQEIFELLNGNNSVAIIGEQGIGKSSLLYAVYQQSKNLLKSRPDRVFIDMNTIHNQEDFYVAICEEIGIPETFGISFNRNLRDRRLLLCLDNVGQLNRERFTRDVRDHLRGLSEGGNACLKLVVAANEPLRTLFNDSYETSPLADICQQVDISVWNEQTIYNFITQRLSSTTIEFTEADIQELIEQSGGHPQRLTNLCYRKYSEIYAK